MIHGLVPLFGLRCSFVACSAKPVKRILQGLHIFFILCIFWLDRRCNARLSHTMTLTRYLEKRGATMRLAEKLGVSPSTVFRWGQRRVPAERLPEVSRATGIPARVLRPDLAQAMKRKRRDD
jgi:DNA-binding transcriptional regulator YdaS (Cro superfamily)